MAYSYVWPTTLPQNPQKGFSEGLGVSVIRTNMDLGPAKMRKRGVGVNTLNITFLFTTEQVNILNNFITNTIKGTARFGFTHPRTQTVTEVRIVPQQSNQFFTSTYAAPGYWNVSLQLEVMP